MRATIPKAVADNDIEPFPVGIFRGKLTEVSTYTNDEGTYGAVNLRFEDVTPLDEASNDPGNRPYTDRITIMAQDEDGNLLALPEIDDFTGDLPFGIRMGAGLLASLADALGAAERDEDRNVLVDIGAFLDALTSETFEGEEVSFQVTHWTNKDKVTRHQTRRFAPVNGAA